MERVCSQPLCATKDTHRLGKGISRLAARPETWKRPRKEPSMETIEGVSKLLHSAERIACRTFVHLSMACTYLPAVSQHGERWTQRWNVSSSFELPRSWEYIKKSVFFRFASVEAKSTNSLIGLRPIFVKVSVQRKVEIPFCPSFTFEYIAFTKKYSNLWSLWKIRLF